MIRGIISVLINNAGVTALIPAANIFPVVAEQKAQRPYVTIRRTGVSPTSVKSTPSELDETFFNITAYTEKYKDSIDILSAIRTAIDNYTQTSEGVLFKRVEYRSSQDLWSEEDESYVIVDSYYARFQRVP